MYQPVDMLHAFVWGLRVECLLSIQRHLMSFNVMKGPCWAIPWALFKNFLEKHKENNEFEMLALGRTGRPASCRLDHDGHLGRAGPAASDI